jgi:hypothetical protein
VQNDKVLPVEPKALEKFCHLYYTVLVKFNEQNFRNAKVQHRKLGRLALYSISQHHNSIQTVKVQVLVQRKEAFS